MVSPFALLPRGTFKHPEHLLNVIFTQHPKEYKMFLEHCSILFPVVKDSKFVLLRTSVA